MAFTAPISTMEPLKTSKLSVSKSQNARTQSPRCTGSVRNRTVWNRQKAHPRRSGSATRRPAASRIILLALIEHRSPEFVTPWHRAAPSRGEQCRSGNEGGIFLNLCQDALPRSFKTRPRQPRPKYCLLDFRSVQNIVSGNPGNSPPRTQTSTLDKCIFARVVQSFCQNAFCTTPELNEKCKSGFAGFGTNLVLWGLESGAAGVPNRANLYFRAISRTGPPSNLVGFREPP